MSWDPGAYLAFDDHRARPFDDLLARVRAAQPRRVVDLGCGPGHLTAELAARWPNALVEALDSSPEMVAQARGRGVAAVLGDIAEWRPAPDADVVVCNAVLQWVPGHDELLRRWISALPPGGEFALQVPGNQESPAHVLARELHPAVKGSQSVLEPREYAELITGVAASVADVWETTYLHRLEGADPVLDWISSTTLRPVREALDDHEWTVFRAELAPRLRAAYPRAADGGTWFPFRRIFAVARRG